MKNNCTFAQATTKIANRAISSAGSEHLVYTEGVGGSNPSSPTEKLQNLLFGVFFCPKI